MLFCDYEWGYVLRECVEQAIFTLGTNSGRIVAKPQPHQHRVSGIYRIFEDPQWDPMYSLHKILEHRKDGSSLDGTYLPVLNRLLNRQGEKQKRQLIQEYKQVVGAIVLLESPLSVISLSKLIGVPEKVVRLRLNQLHSVLSVPDDDTLPVRLFHLSFRDFLPNRPHQQRSNKRNGWR
jgi:hypothetical protein